MVKQIEMKREKAKEVKKNSKPIIILMSKWHAINRCKSRLSREIGAYKAANIQKKLTTHTLKVVKKIQEEELADIKIAIDGIGIRAAKRWALINKIKTIGVQGHGNLGTKMKREFLRANRGNNVSYKRKNPIILIGTDLPSISHIELKQAIKMLSHKDMVLGPSNDGGYWLIGLSNKLVDPMCWWPFSGIEWGTDQVLQKTIRFASLNHIDYQLLQTKNDVDNIIDLSLWLNQKDFKLSVSSYQL